MDISDKKCPRCHEMMMKGSNQNFLMFGCPSCGGVWLNHQTSERIFSTLNPEALRMARAAYECSRKKEYEATNAHLVCPDCSQAMTRTLLDKAQVEIDTCYAHGTFYDRHEIQQIAHQKQKQADYNQRAIRLGVAAGATAGALALSQNPQIQNAASGISVGDVADVAETGIEIAAEVAGDVVLDGVLDVGVEIAGGLAAGAFEILLGIFDLLFNKLNKFSTLYFTASDRTAIELPQPLQW
jgi:Zn-finger nucleic acid-binding protein